MISFEVGAAFQIIDEATGPLERIGAAFRGVEEIVARLQEQFLALGRGGGLFTGLLGGFSEVDTAMKTSIEGVAALGTAIVDEMGRGARAAQAAATEMTEAFARVRLAETEALAAGVAAGRGVGPRATATDKSFLEKVTPPLLSGMGPFALPLLDYESTKNSMEGEYALTETLEELNIRPGTKDYDKKLARAKSLAHETAKNTIFSDVEAEKIEAEYIGLMMKTGDVGLDAAVESFPIAGKLGELMKMMHKGSAADNAVAAARYAHLTGAFTPAEMEPMLDLVSIVAQREHSTIGTQFDIARLGMPMAIAAGVNPMTAEEELAYYESVGGGATTRVGSSFGQAISRIETSGEHKTPEHQKRAQNAKMAFEDSLKLDPEAASREKASAHGNQEFEAFKSLQILNSAGKNMVSDDKGNLDIQKVEQAIYDFGADPKNKGQSEGVLKAAFGENGMRWAQQFLPKFDQDGQPLAPEHQWQDRKAQFVGSKADGSGLRGAPTVAQQQDDMLTTTMQQFQQSIALATNAVNLMTDPTLKTLNSVFQGINSGLTSFNNFLRENPLAASVGGWVLTVATVASAFGILGKAIGFVTGGLDTLAGVLGIKAISRMVGPTTKAATSLLPEVLAGHGEAAGGLGIGLGGIVAAATAASTVILAGGYLSGKAGAPMVDDYGRPVGNWGGPRAGGAPAPANITIHMGGLSLSGLFDEAMKSRILSWITSAFTTANANAGGQVQGSHESPYTGMAGMGF